MRIDGMEQDADKVAEISPHQFAVTLNLHDDSVENLIMENSQNEVTQRV
jgi:hypothetical protein